MSRSDSDSPLGRGCAFSLVFLFGWAHLLTGCTDPDSCLRTTDCLVDAVCQKGTCVSTTQNRPSADETGGEGGTDSQGETLEGGTSASSEAGAPSQ